MDSAKIPEEWVEAAARAAEEARCPGREGPFGLYDYSGNSGSQPPYQVRDFRDPAAGDWGEVVFASHDLEEARARYEEATRRHIYGAALAAVLPLVAAEVEKASCADPETMKTKLGYCVALEVREAYQRAARIIKCEGN